MNKKQQLVPGNEEGDSRRPYCSFHPRELVVGVCAHCLKDRLLHHLASSRDDAPRRRSRASSISLPKVLAFGSSFLLQRLDSRRHQHADDEEEAYYSDDTASVASLDDSFISIKFEDNGKATWDKKAAAGAPVRSSSSTTAAAAVAVVDHVKRGGVTRWRKQVVGRLLQLARWKRSSAGMDGKKKAAAARGRGWIRSLTRRRANGDRAWS